MSPQGDMSRKKASYSPGLDPIKSLNFALVPRLGPEINTRACLWVSPRPCQRVPCWLNNQGPSLVCRSRLETPRAGSGPKKLRVEPPLASPSAVSLPGCREHVAEERFMFPVSAMLEQNHWNTDKLVCALRSTAVCVVVLL